jgi:hypothetical protein
MIFCLVTPLNSIEASLPSSGWKRRPRKKPARNMPTKLLLDPQGEGDTFFQNARLHGGTREKTVFTVVRTSNHT